MPPLDPTNPLGALAAAAAPGVGGPTAPAPFQLPAVGLPPGPVAVPPPDQAGQVLPFPTPGAKLPKRKRRRSDSLKIDKQTVVARVKDFYDNDLIDRRGETDLRLQRYAKLRMWTEGKDFPWPESSDIPLPDIMEKSLRIQDTLHNAVMSQRPVINASPMAEKRDKEKARKIDTLIDFQMFVEQNGEKVIGDLAAAFVEDGAFTAFIPWVREKREVADVRVFDKIPDQQVDPVPYFEQLLRQTFPNAAALPKGSDGWTWEVTDGDDDPFDADFYTKDDDRVEMIATRQVIVHDGPVVIPKEWDEVLHPARAANLQMPGPSNPNGAAHVILVDYPHIDEVRRLAKSGFYDLIDDKEIEALDAKIGASDDAGRIQKDALQGVSTGSNTPKEKSHRNVTRLICFDLYDIDGDGLNEDVIWWVLPEQKILLKAKPLTEMYPANPPRRPLAEAAHIPIRNRRGGISIPEMLEGIHDALKATIDQSVDATTLSNSPFFFYRAAGGIKPEIITLSPGEGYPVGDAANDINFPQIGNPNAQAQAMNMIGMLGQMEDRLTLISPMQNGQVPGGKASALRTTGSVALLLGQGEARPERILRRFMNGLVEIWRQYHELNQAFLPDGKKYRVLGVPQQGEETYQSIDRRSEIQGRFMFDFKANVLNTTRQALQATYKELLGVYVSPLAVQMKMTDANGAYRLMRDYGRSLGIEPDAYIKEPTPGADIPGIFAEEAVSAIMNNQTPQGQPAEVGGWKAHLQRLQGIVDNPDNTIGLLSPEQMDLLKAYMEQVQQNIMQEEQAMMQALRQFQQSQTSGQGQPGAPAQGPPPDASAPVQNQPGKVNDMSLPNASGGGAQAQ